MNVIRFIKSGTKALLRPMGYEIRRITPPPEPDFPVELTGDDAKYYTRWATPCPLFTPWVGHPEFQQIYDGVAPYTNVPPHRCYILMSLARYAACLMGDFAECGVYKGGTALMLSRVINSQQKKLYLFDSFEGLPEPDRIKDIYFSKGDYVGNVAAIKQLLANSRAFVDFREGWMPQTFAGLEQNRYAFVHVDVDIYESTLDCCKYFYSRMVSGGVLVFDEYCEAVAHGEKLAVDEFFADKPEYPIALPTGQALVLKTPLS